MPTFKMFLKCFFSPSLYVSYRDQNNAGRYSPDKWERLGNISLSTAFVLWKLGFYTSPLLAALIYRRGYMNAEGALTFTRITLWFGLLVGASFCLRSYGRASNSYYRNFLTKLNNADSPRGVTEIKSYDFDFTAWPVEFHLPIRTNKTEAPSNRSGLGSLLQSPCSILGYLALHTFGIRLLYPGSMSLINLLLRQNLMEGRRNLVMERNGTRYKLKTPERNTVDSMFIDKRDSDSTRGQTLVVCSDGNAGFYEIGIMGSMADSGFSVLGWNHPGFGCSTGSPYIDEEESAVNTVMEFAVQRLGFTPDNIILYGWSIGGYSSSWAAASYPNIKAIVLDASFDDILPLAINHMPSLLESVVRVTIRSYADLNVARLLRDYPGHIKIVRRSDDEVISIVPGDVTTNRGNYLLRKVLKRRYPNVISDIPLNSWLHHTGTQQRKLEQEKSVNKDECRRIIDGYIYDHGPTFPFMELGKGMDDDIKEQITIYLAGEYMTDYAATHCVPLPDSVFLNLVHNFI